jgi:hypothetical protein
VDAAVEEAWIVDACGRGAFLPEGKAIHIVVRFKDQTLPLGSVAARLQELQRALERDTGLKISVSPWVDAAGPIEGTEILFRKQDSPAAVRSSA